MELKAEERKVLIKKLISECQNDPLLNQWEKEFLISVSNQIDNRDLSEKQNNILEKIKKKLRARF